MMAEGYSHFCTNLTTYWDKEQRRCVPCDLYPGYEVTPNCGRDDDGGIHERSKSRCKNNTFNDGSSPYCQPCTSCPPNSILVRNCNSTDDTICRDPRLTTTAPTTTQIISLQEDGSQKVAPVVWAVPLAVFVLLLALSAFIIKMKRRKGLHDTMFYRRRSSYINEGFCPPLSAVCHNDTEDILSYDILSAPLQTVLDDLDVLEELVILLDPETRGIKNTRHLASHWSFTSSWITYTYSMKDSKSPLKAVLEGVTSKHPDWTVGQLAQLLRQIERNDAVAVLVKLRPSP
ncbi:IGF-like family receptor 1 [Odontesthes bonariensis]|uniref:IGF-like family receptor 1 n=1 Tax=Odontesthes bonariensis TaxID=219752 RepID=UPI003F58A304